MTWRHDLYPNYKKKKRRIDPRDVAPEVGHQQEVDKQQAVQDADMNEEKYLQDPETQDISQPLQIHKDADPIIQQGIAEDVAENAAKDKAIKASGKAWDAGNITVRERIEQLLNAPNAAFKDLQAGAEGFNRQRQLGIDSFAQTVDDIVTGGLERLNAPGSEYIGDRARNITGFLTDVAAPTAEDLALAGVTTALATPAAGGITLAALRMRKFGDEAVDFFMKAKNVISHRNGGKVGVLVDGQVIDRANLSRIFMDDQLARQSAQPMMIKGSKNPNQLNLLEKPIERFMTNKYKREVRSLMNKYGMGDGVFRIDAYDRAKGAYDVNANRFFLERYLSPDKLKGSFSGFTKSNRSGFKQEWADFLKSKGMTNLDIQAHHINPLYDSIHLFDGVKHNSSEYWDIIGTLVSRNARSGVIQRGDDVNNLMMTLGKAVDSDTPHGIAHKFYNRFTPKFFNAKEIEKMKTKPGYRMKKAERWATLVNKSEEIILEAHKQWSLLNPKVSQNLSFDELVEKLSKLNDKGYNKLIDPKYQLPDMNNIIKEIAKDKGLKGPIFKTSKKSVNLSGITKREKMTKEDDIAKELRVMKKKPKRVDPNQGKLPGT